MRPKPPASLSPAAKKRWRALQEEFDIVDAAGLQLLEVGFIAWDTMQKAQAILDEEGLVVESDTTGVKRAHPAVAVLKESRASYLKALSMLNLDIQPPGPIGRPGGK